jgi:plastocyanin
MTRTASLTLALAGALLLSVSPAAAATGTQAAEQVTLIVKSDTEHAKKGPDGAWHDAFLPARMAVKAGSAVTLTIRNYDVAAHSFLAPKLGLNVMLAAGSAAHPSVTTFTFTPPRKGTFTWTCAMNCDPFAMTHVGYMRGRITVT